MEIVPIFCFVLASNSVVGMTTVYYHYLDPFEDPNYNPNGCFDDYGNHYEPYETYKPRPCVFCECEPTGNEFCYQVICEPPACDGPMWLPDRCCPLCPGDETKYCTFKGRRYRTGEEIKGCWRCRCIYGEVFCDYDDSKVPTCAPSGSCGIWDCPNGSDCAANNNTIVPAGQSLILPNGYVCDCYHPSGGRCDRPASLPDHAPVRGHYMPFFNAYRWRQRMKKAV